MSENSKTPVARLCHIIQWKSFDGYGFNLHAEKGKPGQFIGKVDEGSPAEAAGLKQGDSIIEVNGVNIADENHKQVVLRIKAIPNETKLLVVDSEAEKYFKANNIIVKGTMTNVVNLKTPSEDGKLTEEINGDQETKKSEKSDPDSVSQTSSAEGTSPTLSADRSTSISTEDMSTKANGGAESTKTLERNSINTSLNLNMTAKELRAQLASRKKYDPKKDSLDFKKKHDIIQKL